VRECRAFLAAQPEFERITFALFDTPALAVYRALLDAE
jgi:hypothetical protein